MKKILLTIASVAMAIAASATDYTLFDIANKGTWTVEGTGFKWTDGEFTIRTDKGSYNNNLVSPIEYDFSWHVYKGSNFTITSKTVDMKSVVITYDDYVYNGTDYVGPMSFGEGWTGAISNHTYTISNAAGSKTFTASPSEKQVRIKKLIVSTEVKEGGDTPNPPAGGDITVKKATEVAAGEVAFVFDNNDFKGYVETFEYNEAKPYGYWMAVAATPADEMKVTEKAIFTLAKTDKGYTIKDCNGYFMGWDGTHFSFNAYKTSDEGHCYWNATMVDGNVKIVNVDKYVDKDQKECDVYLAGKKYNSDYEMCLTSYDNNPLPMLYVKGEGSGVANIAVENNGEAVYYNLQGVRVENPVKGLYIVVKGGKSQKVML